MAEMLLLPCWPGAERTPPRPGGNVAGDVRACSASRPGQGPDWPPHLGGRAVRGRDRRARVQLARCYHEPAPGLPGTCLGTAPFVAEGGAARCRPGAVLRGVLDPGRPAVPPVRRRAGTAGLPRPARCGFARARRVARGAALSRDCD